ncbi:BPTI/Kunitz domain-containing protein-like [Crotalus tigris]|uniref:BPTI/Kunitz domain-containing protein-like n=1 Tax=Crotalus tigris TaxID=88082 RepID=UPI00192F45C6|nr:BPTI/Kunitz domain-containing protein-like [Crotalus tigris]
MRSGRSLLLLLWGVLALWSPLLPASNDYVTRCATVSNKSKRCSSPQEVFFYNITSKKCERFTDYACPNILNRYFTLEDCQYYCAHDDYCQLPPDPGPCHLKKPRWFYDPKTQSCKSFTFGGCLGNVNNFNNQDLCSQSCPQRGSP